MKCFSNTFVHYVYFFTLQKENRTQLKALIAMERCVPMMLLIVL